jgi:hypothetical protein
VGAHLQPQALADDGDRHVDRDCSLWLGLHRVLAGAIESLTPQILFDPPEKQLRLRSGYSRLTLVRSPVLASWLNKIEICFWNVQRKILTPNDFPDLYAVAKRLLDSQYYRETTA